MASLNKKINNTLSDKQEVVSITYEEIGLFPRSFSRVLDRFLKQVFSDVENLVIQEYRFYRYLFLTTLKCLLILVFVPLFVNFVAKTYIVRPLTEYFWNTKQTEIFLNSYQQKHAFAELKDFEEKIYFESLIYPKSASLFMPSRASSDITPLLPQTTEADSDLNKKPSFSESEFLQKYESPKEIQRTAPWAAHREASTALQKSVQKPEVFDGPLRFAPGRSAIFVPMEFKKQSASSASAFEEETAEKQTGFEAQALSKRQGSEMEQELRGAQSATPLMVNSNLSRGSVGRSDGKEVESFPLNSEEKAESFLNSYTLKSSLFVYQTQEADKNIQQRYQEKTIELAQRYNDQSIEAITNFFADLISLISLFYLLYALEIQINITKSFLLEVFFGLDDSKKSLLILLITDLLVGYHSSNLWELFFEFLFHHYGLPESQTGIFLLVATLPVLLDVLFKYLIFRHLNRSSPATVATYHAMIE
uniref:Potassium/proton antiporter CemA n=1 Tax=Chlorosarcinopsis eremi TaxID=332213 RepID=A0A5C2FQE6_9CHLO|nr:chloroplast envelope membrane protein [Chlorosarcinopsis eremi]AYQ94453.1 chloroplast envelope membrane protein [Chlorosarcinopsis eremi]QEP09196.1 chloroplast envelope membrane protein [Chlorosarcinopsis eremi]